MTDPKIAIVGGGPAGMAAAMQLQRYGLNPTLYESNELGGLLRNANFVENYLGFPDGISGTALVNDFSRQLTQFDVNVKNERVSRILSTDPGFTLELTQHVKEFDLLVLATGTKPISISTEFTPVELAERVMYEVVDLRHHRDSKITIVGAGDAAFDYALQLANFNDVFINNRSDRMRALKPLIERVRNHERIEYREWHELLHVESGKGQKLNLTWQTKSGEVTESSDELLCAIGREPNLDCIGEAMLPRLSELQEAGRLFIIGDLANDRYRQTSIAVGDGIKAAMQIWSQVEQAT